MGVLLVMIAMGLVFGAVGWFLAEGKGRSAGSWALAGFCFPPLLLVLLVMPEGDGAPGFEDMTTDPQWEARHPRMRNLPRA